MERIAPSIPNDCTGLIMWTQENPSTFTECQRSILTIGLFSLNNSQILMLKYSSILEMKHLFKNSKINHPNEDYLSNVII